MTGRTARVTATLARRSVGKVGTSDGEIVIPGRMMGMGVEIGTVTSFAVAAGGGKQRGLGGSRPHGAVNSMAGGAAAGAMDLGAADIGAGCRNRGSAAADAIMTEGTASARRGDLGGMISCQIPGANPGMDGAENPGVMTVGTGTGAAPGAAVPVNRRPNGAAIGSDIMTTDAADRLMDITGPDKWRRRGLAGIGAAVGVMTVGGGAAGGSSHNMGMGMTSGIGTEIVAMTVSADSAAISAAGNRSSTLGHGGN